MNKGPFPTHFACVRTGHAATWWRRFRCGDVAVGPHTLAVVVSLKYMLHIRTTSCILLIKERRGDEFKPTQPTRSGSYIHTFCSVWTLLSTVFAHEAASLPQLFCGPRSNGATTWRHSVRIRGTMIRMYKPRRGLQQALWSEQVDYTEWGPGGVIYLFFRTAEMMNLTTWLLVWANSPRRSTTWILEILESSLCCLFLYFWNEFDDNDDV